MSKRKEKLSAFLDSDLHQDELMSFSLSAEPEDAEVVQRYQMVGDALRGEMSESSFVDVSHAVREALANENIANENIADSMTADVAPQPADNTTASSSSKFDWSAWFRPAAGMAVAASVVVVMVTSFSEQGGIAPLADNVDQQSVEQPVQVAAERSIGDKKPMSNKDMDPYITQHLEFATQDALQGRLPYVRAVSFESNKNVEPAQTNK